MGFLIFLIGARLYFSGNDLLENLSTGETQLTQEFGFINWGHANSSETKRYYEEFLAQMNLSQDSIDFSYRQNVRMQSFGLTVSFGFEECRRFKTTTNKTQQQLAFLEIFENVSQQFETMQNQLPLSFLPGASNSSFRNGDLNGNLISVFKAFENISTNELKNDLRVSSKVEAITTISNYPILTTDRRSFELIVQDWEIKNPKVQNFFSLVQSQKSTPKSRLLYYKKVIDL